jgi:hypothetical protein
MITPRTTVAITLLLITQLTACSDSSNKTPEVQSVEQGRLFDSQRATLEQARAAADFANQRSQEYERQSQALDNGKN